MTPSLPIDIRVHGIRIAQRSRTTLPKQRANYIRMCRRLGELGRLDILRALSAGTLTFADVWVQYRAGEGNLPAPELFEPLEAAWARWLKGKTKLAERTRQDYQESLTRLLAYDGAASISDLPRLLARHARESAETRPSAFNRDRAAVRSFLATRVGHFHPLYGEVSRLEPLAVERQPINPQTPDQVRAIAEWLTAHQPRFRPTTYAYHARTLWGLCLTGMRPEEFWEEAHGKKRNSWQLEEDRVSIRGTKNPAAVRPVPRLAIITKPESTADNFGRALGTACEKLGMTHVTVYDCRRSYANWLGYAGIPDNRQDAYMGHGAKNMRELYRRPGDLARFLQEDREALQRYIGLIGGTTGLAVVR